MGADNVWPGQSPPDITDKHLTHDFAGPDGGIAAVPLGQGTAQLTLRWDVTGWIPGMDRQPLRVAMMAVQVALTGAERLGKQHRFVASDGSGWHITCRDGGPVRATPEIGPIGLWQRVSSRYVIELRQLAGAS